MCVMTDTTIASGKFSLFRVKHWQYFLPAEKAIPINQAALRDIV